MGSTPHRRVVIIWLWNLHLASAIALVPLSYRESEPEEVIATCQDGFSWMSNRAGRNPCELNSVINKMCMDSNSTWSVPPAGNAPSPYNAPSQDDRTATVCSCSWAAYNTLSGCTACQGVSGGIYDWTTYTHSCASLLSPGYLPSNVTTAEDTSIPVWAIQDPKLWPGHTFNVTKASEFKDKGDVLQVSVPRPSGTPTQLLAHSRPPLGLIAVGTCAGLVVLSILAFFLMKARRNLGPKDESKQSSDVIPFPPLEKAKAMTMTVRRTQSLTALDGVTSSGPTGRYHPNAPPRRVGLSKEGKTSWKSSVECSARRVEPPVSPQASRCPPPSYREFG